MKKIDIQIDKAQIESFSVKLNEDKPDVSVTIGLYTNQNKKITTYSISTDSWRDEMKFELKPSLVSPILEIMRELEAITVRHCREGQKTLGTGAFDESL